LHCYVELIAIKLLSGCEIAVESVSQ